MFSNRYTNRRVLVTGHTGFKGSWLSEWLLRLGADVHGLALAPQPHETLFDQLGLSERLTSHELIDVRDAAAVRQCVEQVEPEFIFHLAAQPLVRLSFKEPLETFSTNVMGTANVLDAVHKCKLNCSVVVVTTDKCYENREWVHSYREEDPMGGFDPYSASKGCAELVTSSYRRSFFNTAGSAKISSARAGNVIGGGDWAVDRIVPDIFRSIKCGQPIRIRNRHATRPWQHVLEPLSGYLWLAAKLDGLSSESERHVLTTAFNFGPSLASNRTVLDLVETVLEHTNGEYVDESDPTAPHEAGKLNLSIEKAFHNLNWWPTWGFEEAVKKTTDWYLSALSASTSVNLCQKQIGEYCSAARTSGVAWAHGAPETASPYTASSNS